MRLKRQKILPALKWIKSDRKLNGTRFMFMRTTKQTNYFDLRENFANKTISIIHPGLSSATCKCNWKQAEVGGNRFSSLKLICRLTERDDWSAARAFRNQHLSSVICQSYFGSMQQWKVIFCPNKNRREKTE